MNGVLHPERAPDTPMEVITELLKRALHTDDPSASKALVQRAYDVASGLDDYLEAVSSPPSEVSICATSRRCPTSGIAGAQPVYTLTGLSCTRRYAKT